MNKIFVILFLIVGMFVFLVGCTIEGYGIFKESDFTIKLSGTEGLKFMGNYMIMEPNGNSLSKSVEAYIPAEYHVRGSMVSCSFQKQTKRGKLKVEILKDGKVVSESETSATYGVVTIATQ